MVSRSTVCELETVVERTAGAVAHLDLGREARRVGRHRHVMERRSPACSGREHEPDARACRAPRAASGSPPSPRTSRHCRRSPSARLRCARARRRAAGRTRSHRSARWAYRRRRPVEPGEPWSRTITTASTASGNRQSECDEDCGDRHAGPPPRTLRVGPAVAKAPSSRELAFGEAGLELAAEVGHRRESVLGPLRERAGDCRVEPRRHVGTSLRHPRRGLVDVLHRHGDEVLTRERQLPRRAARRARIPSE